MSASVVAGGEWCVPLTLAQVAELCTPEGAKRLTVTTVRGWVNTGRVPKGKRGTGERVKLKVVLGRGGYLVDERDLEEFMRGEQPAAIGGRRAGRQAHRGKKAARRGVLVLGARGYEEAGR